MVSGGGGAEPTPTPPTGCNAPTLLSPADNSTVHNRQVTLDWQDPGCNKKYTVVVRDTSNHNVVVRAKRLTKTRFTTIALEPGKTYTWRVTIGKGLRSPVWHFKIGRKAKLGPNAPSELPEKVPTETTTVPAETNNTPNQTRPTPGPEPTDVVVAQAQPTATEEVIPTGEPTSEPTQAAIETEPIGATSVPADLPIASEPTQVAQAEQPTVSASATPRPPATHNSKRAATPTPTVKQVAKLVPTSVPNKSGSNSKNQTTRGPSGISRNAVQLIDDGSTVLSLLMFLGSICLSGIAALLYFRRPRK